MANRVEAVNFARNAKEIDPILWTVSSVREGNSARVVDVNDIGFRGMGADNIFLRKDFWRDAERVLVLVDEPDDFIRQCRLRKYPTDLVKEIKTFCRADREGWNEVLKVGHRLEQNMNGLRSGPDRQLGLIIVDDLRYVKQIDFDAAANFEWLVRAARNNGIHGKRGDLSILVFDDDIMDVKDINGKMEFDTTLDRLRSAFYGVLPIKQRPIFR